MALALARLGTVSKSRWQIIPSSPSTAVLCGSPVRVVAGGAPALTGSTMSERRAHFLAEFDWIRTALMFEPRGHDMMSGSILYPPTRPDCDIGVLFIETSGCLPMCGHGTIGTVTMALERGLVQPKTPGRCGSTRRPACVEAELRAETAPMSSGCGSPTCRRSSLRPGSRPTCRAWAAHRRRRLWRQLLRHRRAAEELSRPRAVPGGPKGAWRGARWCARPLAKVAVRASRKTRDRGLSHVMWTGSPLQPGARAQCGVLRRQGDRPISVRHRHLGAHGAVGGARGS